MNGNSDFNHYLCVLALHSEVGIDCFGGLFQNVTFPIKCGYLNTFDHMIASNGFSEWSKVDNLKTV